MQSVEIRVRISSQTNDMQSIEVGLGLGFLTRQMICSRLELGLGFLTRQMISRRLILPLPTPQNEQLLHAYLQNSVIHSVILQTSTNQL